MLALLLSHFTQLVTPKRIRYDLLQAITVNKNKCISWHARAETKCKKTREKNVQNKYVGLRGNLNYAPCNSSLTCLCRTLKVLKTILLTYESHNTFISISDMNAIARRRSHQIASSRTMKVILQYGFLVCLPQSACEPI